MKPKKTEPPKSVHAKTAPVFSVPTYVQHIVFIGILFILLSAIYANVAFKGYVPQASDTIQWRAEAEAIIQYNNSHHDQALWTPNVFSGMPSYLISLPNKYPFVENMTRVVDHVMNWRIFLLFFGSLGIYVLMIFLKFDPFIAFISALAFAFTSHWAGLIEIGHNTKFRAVMYIPWLLYSVLYARKKTNLLSFGLFSMFLIAQLRENHPQITYYTLLCIGIYWVFSFFMPPKKDGEDSMITKQEVFAKPNIIRFTIFTVIIITSLLVAAMAVANPLLSTYEYGKYTIRGGSTGLEKSYAQGWSFHPAEIITFAIPSFFGGVGETYWGWMEFTQIYNYLGIIILLLAFIAIFKSKNRFVTFMTVASVIFIFMSFGRHFNLLSDLLMKYLPGFNKFRVPSMILVVVQVLSVVLAGFGIHTVIELRKNNDTKFFRNFQKVFFVTIALMIVIFLFGKAIFAGLPFASAPELAQYKASDLAGIKAQRLDILVKSTTYSLLFLIAGMGLILAYGKEKLGKNFFFALLAIVIFVDMWRVDSEFLNILNLQQASEQQAFFDKTPTDDFLLQDKGLYRIYPLNTQLKGRWAYYHQTIEGYHGAKLKRYQEVLENCLNAMLQKNQINWNLLNMLNTKYILFQSALPFPNTKPVYQSEQEKLVVSENMTVLPRAWFVKNLIVEKEPKRIWALINSSRFNPAETAIVEEPVKGVESPGNTSASVTDFGMQKMALNVSTDKPAFLTVSEVYYPAGWKAFIDGKETTIYPTNYILRGVVVPAGKHKLEMIFAPKSYYTGIRLSLAGILISLLSVLLGIVLVWRKKKAAAAA